MKLRLTTKSNVLLGSGEGTAMVDADSTFHASGFPYIPGRRLKGLLRESLIEVMEIYGETPESIATMVSELFGTEGANGPKGGLVVPNLYLTGWQRLLSQTQLARQSNGGATTFHAENVKRYYCTEIPQTAVEGGVAKDGSLRMYRVLSPGHAFEAEMKLPDGVGLAWFQRAIANLRVAGTRRNKGFGEVRLELTDSQTTSSVPSQKTSELNLSLGRLQIIIETVSPVLLSLREGEQNTVSTERHIPGSSLRGLIAEQLIRKKNLGSLAHQEEDFLSLVLNGALQFGPCFLENTLPLPLNLQQPKGTKDDNAYNGFVSNVPKLRAIGGTGIVGETLTKHKSKTTFMFHNSRPDRKAGKSMEGDASQGIFYYEALAEGQRFVGELAAKPETLAKLVETIGQDFVCQMGRSRSAQYGRVRVQLSTPTRAPETLALSPSHTYYLSATSPIIMYNGFGEAVADVAQLVQTMEAAGIVGVEIGKAFTQIKLVEQYNSIWESKTPRCPAYAAGSVFELKVPPASFDALSKLQQLGEWADLGFGKVNVQPSEIVKEKLKVEASNTFTEDSGELITEPVLIAIRNKSQQQLREVQVKNESLQVAKQRKVPLPNHLSSWILAKLGDRHRDTVKWKAEWTNWLTDLQDRKQKAYKTLSEFQLFEPMLKLQPLMATSEAGTEELVHIYWTTFFETTRKQNRKAK